MNTTFPGRRRQRQAAVKKAQRLAARTELEADLDELLGAASPEAARQATRSLRREFHNP